MLLARASLAIAAAGLLAVAALGACPALAGALAFR